MTCDIDFSVLALFLGLPREFILAIVAACLVIVACVAIQKAYTNMVIAKIESSGKDPDLKSIRMSALYYMLIALLLGLFVGGVIYHVERTSSLKAKVSQLSFQTSELSAELDSFKVTIRSTLDLDAPKLDFALQSTTEPEAVSASAIGKRTLQNGTGNLNPPTITAIDTAVARSTVKRTDTDNGGNTVAFKQLSDYRKAVLLTNGDVTTVYESPLDQLTVNGTPDVDGEDALNWTASFICLVVILLGFGFTQVRTVSVQWLLASTRIPVVNTIRLFSSVDNSRKPYARAVINM